MKSWNNSRWITVDTNLLKINPTQSDSIPCFNPSKSKPSFQSILVGSRNDSDWSLGLRRIDFNQFRWNEIQNVFGLTCNNNREQISESIVTAKTTRSIQVFYIQIQYFIETQRTTLSRIRNSEISSSSILHFVDYITTLKEVENFNFRGDGRIKSAWERLSDWFRINACRILNGHTDLNGFKLGLELVW